MTTLGRRDAASWRRGAFVAYGGPGGSDPDGQQLLEGTGFQNVGAAGDVDGDGFADVVTGVPPAAPGEPEPLFGTLLFGSADGLDPQNALALPGGEDERYGDPLEGVGDLNGDGLPEFAVGSVYDGDWFGAVYIHSPTCTWYFDADGDGHGDPGTTLSSCHTRTGYVARPDDCDDADAGVQGATWYPDAPDDTVDGIDQDCDDHDGPWAVDTADCPDDTGDTGDTGDSGAAEGPGDSAAPPATHATDPG